MSKTNGTTRKGPTHFETVPLELVRVIAVADLPIDQPSVVADAIAPVKKLWPAPVPTRAPVGKKR